MSSELGDDEIDELRDLLAARSRAAQIATIASAFAALVTAVGTLITAIALVVRGD